MNVRRLIALVFVAFMAIFNQAHAVVLGGEKWGWYIDTNDIPLRLKKNYDLRDEMWANGQFRTFSKAYSLSRLYNGGGEKREWLATYVTVVNNDWNKWKSSAFVVWAVEASPDTTLLDFKNTNYYHMGSQKLWFEEQDCKRSEINKDIQMCGVKLYLDPPFVTYAAFYEFRVSGRTFYMGIRNTPMAPANETPWNAIHTLVSLIKFYPPPVSPVEAQAQ